MAEFGAVLLFGGTFRELPLSRFSPVLQTLQLHQADILPVAMWSANVFVAEFTRMKNLKEGIATRVASGCRIHTEEGLSLFSNATLEGRVTFGIRPEQIHWLSGELQAAPNHFAATVAHTSVRPAYQEVELDLGFPLVTYQPSNAPNARRVSLGEIIPIYLPPEAVKVFPSSDEP
jgi:hypothetical protein